MSKYIIDVGEGYIRHGLERTLTIPVRINEHEDHWMDTRIPVTPYTELDTNEAYQRGREDAIDAISSKEQSIAYKAYQSGLSDAWVMARNIDHMSDDDIKACFGCGFSGVFEKYTASEAIDRITAYEQEKEEQIQVGDEVIAKLSGIKYVIVKVEGSRLIGFSIGNGTCNIDAQFVEKTGRHFHEIATVLAKMKEES